MTKATETLTRYFHYLHTNLFTHHIIPALSIKNKVDKCNFMVPVIVKGFQISCQSNSTI